MHAHNLTLDKNSLYLTKFVCHFGRYRFIRLSFGVIPADDSFQQMIDKMFKDLLNILGTADDILFVGYDADGKDHGRT